LVTQAETHARETAYAESDGRLLATVRLEVPAFNLQQNVDVRRRPGFEVGQNRAPTRFAEGGHFAAPIVVARGVVRRASL
jgi:hypothetical protein